MSSDKKIIEGGGEGSSHDTPQAITITIMAPSALETTTIDSALVTSVEAQDARQSDSSLLVVPAEGEESISVTHGTKDLLQTVTETHMGNEDLPVISNINNAEVATEGSTITEESTIKLVTKKEKLDVPIVSDDGDDLVIHCLICNEEFDEGEQVPVFKSLTSTSHRKVSVFLGILVGQKLTSRKAHSNIICQKCFGLLNKLDLLEVQIRDTKEEIVTKYQDTVSKYGGRARRKKPTAVKKSEYVFPKLEPEDEDQQALSLEMDETFEPRVDDLMEEEHDRHEDQDSHDEEWEPEFKRTRVKRDLSNPDSSVPPKRKRGRPRKDASKSKEKHIEDLVDSNRDNEDTQFSFAASVDANECQNVKVEQKTPEVMPEKQVIFTKGSEDKPLLSGCNNASHPEMFKVRPDLTIDFKTLCCSCGHQSNSREEYMEHLLVNHFRSFKCPKCPCVYSSSPHLIRHQRLIHSGTQQRTSKSTNPVKHRETRERDRNQCTYCSEMVDTDMSDHLEIHLYGENECPVCTTAFYTSQAMETHIETCHSESLSSFQKLELLLSKKTDKKLDKAHHLELCDVCGKAVTSYSKLAQHRYSEHPEHYPWSCSSCNLSFPSVGDRERHLCYKKRSRRSLRQPDCSNGIMENRNKMSSACHHNQTSQDGNDLGDSITCPVCSIVLISRKAFTDHVRSHKRSGFKCKFCDAKVKSMASLRAHLSTKHTHREIHQCGKCSQIFFSAGRLSYHLRRHHTDRNTYRNLCHLCGKSYPYPYELRLHLRSHQNERPYMCDQCPKTFIKTGDLTYHKRSHTGERPHKCPHCDARFPRPNTLMSHIRQQHQENAAMVSTVDASTTTLKATGLQTTLVKKTTPPTSAAASSTTVLVLSPNSRQPGTSVEEQEQQQQQKQQQQQQIDAAMSVKGEADATEGPEPVVDGPLVEAVVDGEVAEVQPMQYVQVDGLGSGQAVQAVQAVPHMMEGMEYDETACGPYQIVHLHILQ